MPIQRRHLLFRVLCVVFAALIALACYGVYQRRLSRTARGLGLNQAAWEATYRERGLAVPELGPREGYWGQRMGDLTPDIQLGWRSRQIQSPGLFDVDQFGCQYYRPKGTATRKMLILGGSAAWGTYASFIDQTYFHRLGAQLEAHDHPTHITVMAAGAWKSIQDLRALQLYGPKWQPDLVVFFNGLNDLTNGPTFDSLHDGSNVEALGNDRSASTDTSKYFHAHDYDQRVAFYLDNMQQAADWTATSGCQLLLVLQPALFERRDLSAIEQALLEESLAPHASHAALLQSYQQIRSGLQKLAQQEHVHFLDCSRLYDEEKTTTFTDMWHFSDPGHEILAERMAEAVESIWRNE